MCAHYCCIGSFFARCHARLGKYQIWPPCFDERRALVRRLPPLMSRAMGGKRRACFSSSALFAFAANFSIPSLTTCYKLSKRQTAAGWNQSKHTQYSKSSWQPGGNVLTSIFSKVLLSL
jgi:hypothetical protein